MTTSAQKTTQRTQHPMPVLCTAVPKRSRTATPRYIHLIRNDERFVLQCFVREYSEMSYNPLPPFHPMPSTQARPPKCMKIDQSPRLAGNTMSNSEFEAPGAEVRCGVSVKRQASRLITITSSLAQRKAGLYRLSPCSRFPLQVPIDVVSTHACSTENQ